MVGVLRTSSARKIFLSLLHFGSEFVARSMGQTLALLLFYRTHCGERAKRLYWSQQNSAAIDNAEPTHYASKFQIQGHRRGAPAAIAGRIRRICFDRGHHHRHIALSAVLTNDRLARLRA